MGFSVGYYFQAKIPWGWNFEVQIFNKLCKNVSIFFHKFIQNNKKKPLLVLNFGRQFERKGVRNAGKMSISKLKYSLTAAKDVRQTFARLI